MQTVKNITNSREKGEIIMKKKFFSAALAAAMVVTSVFSTTSVAGAAENDSLYLLNFRQFIQYFFKILSVFLKNFSFYFPQFIKTTIISCLCQEIKGIL